MPFVRGRKKNSYLENSVCNKLFLIDWSELVICQFFLFFSPIFAWGMDPSRWAKWKSILRLKREVLGRRLCTTTNESGIFFIINIFLLSCADLQRESATPRWKWANWWARGCGDTEPAFLRRPEKWNMTLLRVNILYCCRMGLITNFDNISRKMPCGIPLLLELTLLSRSEVHHFSTRMMARSWQVPFEISPSFLTVVHWRS